MKQTGRYPGGLLQRQETVRGIRLDFDRPLERVLKLVEVMGVPVGDQIRAVVGERSRQHRSAFAHIDEAGR